MIFKSPPKKARKVILIRQDKEELLCDHRYVLEVGDWLLVYNSRDDKYYSYDGCSLLGYTPSRFDWIISRIHRILNYPVYH